MGRDIGELFVRKYIAYSLAFILALAAGKNMYATTDDSSWLQQLQQWRTDRAASLSAPDGWLSLVGLEWLKPGDNSFGTSPDSRIRLHAPGNAQFGIIDVEQNGLRLKAPKDGFPKGLLVDGHPATEQAIVVDGRNPTTFTDGTLAFFVIRRGDQVALRIKDSQGPVLVGFHGLHWYAPNPRYKIEAEWVPFPEPKHEAIQNVVGQSTDGLVFGVAKFTLDGQEIRLEAVVQNENARNLLFVIRDATSGKATYAASRFLHTGLPDQGLRQSGKLVLDFNRLENPPCAYTPYATCPLPPDSNRLKVSLPVGELKYSH
jgi:uncharacterized protein